MTSGNARPSEVQIRRNEPREWCSARDPALVSIITATMNPGKKIVSCLESVKRQSFSRVEHVIIDGGSKDNTVSLLAEMEYLGYKWISENDAGIYDAWNKGIELASGEWIAFLGADDELLPNAIELLYHRAQMESGVEFVSGKISRLGKHGLGPSEGERWQWSRFRRYMNIAHPGALHKRSLIRRVGGFNPDYKVAGDYELLLRAGPSLKAAFVDQVVTLMGEGGASDSLNVLREAERAKVETNARARSTARIERYIASAKLLGRRMIGS